MTEQQQKARGYKVGFWGVSAIITTLIFVVCPLVFLYFICDSYALVEETESIDIGSVAKVKNIAKNVYSDLMAPGSAERSEITLSESEINSIVALTARGIVGLKGRVNVTPVGIKAAFTFSVPQNPFGDYVNLTGIITPSLNGLSVNYISIGSLDLPGDWTIALAETLLNQFLSGETTGTKLINSIESIRVNGSKITLAYHPVPELKQVIEQTKWRVKNIRNDLTLLASPEDVKLYYQNICQLHSKIGGLGNVSLAYYLSDTFSYAEKRSLINEQPGEENKAALLALAIFLGSANFDSLIGAIDEETFQRCQPQDSSIVLANRNDLRLHFIFSAALKIISDSSISYAIGEFKELLDTQQGGTGFSFTDLAADRAGIRFAELALSNSGALRIQRMTSKLTQEKMFFPSLSALPDGISQHAFEERGGIESDYYKEYLAMINKRIDNLPLYESH